MFRLEGGSAQEIEKPISEIKDPKQELSVQQKALISGMLQEVSNVTTQYEIQDGERFYEDIFQEGDFESLVQKFKKDPKDCLALGRNNLMAIMADKEMPLSRRQERVRRYVDAFLDLIIKLDRAAFPPAFAEVKRGVPEYIPDGLSDLGSDPETDPKLRNREKIRVDKENIFAQSKELFYEIFSEDLSDINSSKMKEQFALKASQFVYDKMPYNYKKQAELTRHETSFLLSDITDRELAVCRHHALYSQVLFQAMGLTTRLLKCDVSFSDGRSGGHAVNLFRNNGQWYLMDVTIPDQKDGKTVPFLRPISEEDVDVNKKNYTWTFRRGDGTTCEYKTRNNMHYYIKDNRQPL